MSIALEAATRQRDQLMRMVHRQQCREQLRDKAVPYMAKRMVCHSSVLLLRMEHSLFAFYLFDE
jgi:hypothetical protein